MIESLSKELIKIFESSGLSNNAATNLSMIIVIIIAIILAVLLDRILYGIGKKVLTKAVAKTATNWDDILLKNKLLTRVIHLIPAFFLLSLDNAIFYENLNWQSIYIAAIELYLIILIIIIVNSFLRSINEIYLTYEGSKNRPIKGYIQTIQIIAVIFGIITAISILLGQSLIVIVGGMGAFAAVLMLIFKDSILGFVAGIQISFNDLVRLGDWISIPKFGADGVVMDIALTTIKIQNWDKTISTVPSYSLISDSFQNWRGMEESGGRRIKRSIYIDMNSIRFCDKELLDKLSKIQIIKEYIESTETLLKKHNETFGIDSDILVNGRRQTNIGIFRAYLKAYLKRKTEINTEMTFLVRQLQPTEHGIPIEIYVFSKVQEWGEYENIQADIFDHVLAAVPQFELRIFQNPSGGDFQKIIDNKS